VSDLKSTLAYQDCKVTLVPKRKWVLSATMLNRYLSASSTIQHTVRSQVHTFGFCAKKTTNTGIMSTSEPHVTVIPVSSVVWKTSCQLRYVFYSVYPFSQMNLYNTRGMRQTINV
jgi:hypothetical protein